MTQWSKQPKPFQKLTHPEERRILRQLRLCRRRIRQAVEASPLHCPVTCKPHLNHLGVQRTAKKISLLACESRTASPARLREIVGQAGESAVKLRARAERIGRHATRANELSRRFVEVNLGHVHRWVAYYKRFPGFWNIDTDELIQEACTGLLRAIDLYDPDRGLRFSTYATPWIRNRILDYIGKHQRRRKIQSLNTDIPSTTELCGADILPASDGDAAHSSVVFAEEKEMLQAALSRLDPVSLDVMASLYGLGRDEESRRGYSRRTGMSLAQVRSIERKAMRVLRRYLPKSLGREGEE